MAIAPGTHVGAYEIDLAAAASGCWLALTLALVAGCAAPPAPSAEKEATAPTSEAGGAREADSLVVRTWVTACSSGDDMWPFRHSTTIVCEEKGKYLEGAEGSFEWPVNHPTSEIDTLVVEGEALDAVGFRLWWAAAGQALDAERSIDPDGPRSGPHEVVFDLAAQPGWRGELRRLRLTWTGAPTPATRVTGSRVEKLYEPGRRDFGPSRGVKP